MLVSALASDSLVGEDPEWSPPFRQIASAPASAPIAALEARAREGDGGAVLPLLALRRIAPASYAKIPARLRAVAFASALLTSPRFNTWGLPREPLGEASTAAGELGSGLVSAFVPLLSIDRRAPLAGSRVAMEADIREVRVCDHAYAIVCAMLRRPFRFEPTADARSRAIHELRTWLSANPGAWD